MLDRRDAALFAFLAVAWGGAYAATEVGLRYLAPVPLSALRYDVAAATLLAVVYARERRWYPTTAGDLAAVVATGAFVVAGGSVFLFYGQLYTTGGVAAVLFSLNPVLAGVFASALLADERLDARAVAGLAVGLLGVALVVRPDPSSLLAAETVGKGFVLLAAVAVSLGSVLVRLAPRRAPSAVVTGWGMALGAALVHAVAAVRGVRFTLPTAPPFWAAFAYLTLAATVAAYVVYFALLDRYGATRLNLVSYATPPVAAFAGAVVLSERLARPDVLGLAFAFCAFALVRWERLAEDLD